VCVCVCVCVCVNEREREICNVQEIVMLCDDSSSLECIHVCMFIFFVIAGILNTVEVK